MSASSASANVPNAVTRSNSYTSFGSPPHSPPLMLEAARKQLLSQPLKRSPFKNPYAAKDLSKKSAQNLEAYNLGAMTKIQAVIRGHLTRNKTLLPDHVRPHLEKLDEFKQPKEVHNHTILFCRLMNDMMGDKNYRDKTIAINSTFTTHEDPAKPNKGDIDHTVTLINEGFLKKNDSASSPLIFKTDYDSRMELSNDGKTIRLLIIPKTKNEPITNLLLGKGAYKNVYALHELSFTRIKGIRSCMYTPQVLLKTDNTPEPNKQKSSPDIVPLKLINKTVMQGLLSLKTLMEKLPAFVQGKFMSLPHRLVAPQITRDDTAIPDSPLEYTQPWCNGTLSEAIKSRQIPLSFKPTPETLPLKTRQIISIFQDVAEQLHYIHAANSVHGDIKAPNILLKTSSDNNTTEVKGFITDFDLVEKIGGQLNVSAHYPYWDSIARKFGVATPFCDCYGLAVTFLVSLVPDFAAEGILKYRVIDDYYKGFYDAWKSSTENDISGDTRLKKIKDEKEQVFKDIQDHCHHTFFNFVKVNLSEHEGLKYNILKDISRHFEKNPSYESLYSALQHFISNPHGINNADLRLLEALRKDISLKNALLSYALVILKQDLLRVEELIQDLISHGQNPTHWSRVKARTSEEESRALNGFLLCLNKVRTVSAKDIHQTLNNLKINPLETRRPFTQPFRTPAGY